MSLQHQDSSVSATSSQLEMIKARPGESQNISNEVLVQETSFYTGSKAHKEDITCVVKLSDTEVLTSSTDKSFKVWDTILKGCSYTIQTFNPLNRMCCTGEAGNAAARQLVASQGEGSFFVLGLHKMQQNCIKEMAHDNTIIQIITLTKQKEKYFATRCADGDVSIYSSSAEPDQVYMFENVDQTEEASTQLQDTHRESAKPEEEPKEEEKNEDEEEQEGDGDEEEEVDEDGNPIEKKKPPTIIEPKKKDKSGRISSADDNMIELEPQPLPVAGTAVVICFSNFRESFINIQSFDLKTRRKTNLKTYNLSS